MGLIRFLFSPRLWVILILGAGVIVELVYENTQDFLLMYIIGLFVTFVISAGIILKISYVTYDVDTVRGYVRDVLTDYVFSIISFTATVVAGVLGFSWYAIGFGIVAIFLSFGDFIVSVKGGASKLHEADRTSVHRG